MGGLIARHAAGHLFDPATGLVAGLRPAHFVTMATPHLGCEVAASPAQVEFEGLPARDPAAEAGGTVLAKQRMKSWHELKDGR